MNYRKDKLATIADFLIFEKQFYEIFTMCKKMGVIIRNGCFCLNMLYRISEHMFTELGRSIFKEIVSGCLGRK